MPEPVNKHDNETEYISFSEAAARIGKSEMTVRRLVKKPAAKQHIKTENGAIVVSSEFVKTVYPLDYKSVNAVNSNDNLSVNGENRSDNAPNKPVNSDNAAAAILQARLEEKEVLIASLQQQVDRTEKQFEEYRQEKKQEIERMFERWKAEQEIFKRDQDLAAGKLLSQQVQEVPEPDKTDKTDTIKKKPWWKF